MKKKYITIPFLFLIILFISGYFLLKPVFFYLSGYLSKSEQVSADVLIVEGWLPQSSLEIAYNEYKKGGYKYIVTTGMNSYTEYLKVHSTGFLIFYPDKSSEYMIEADSHLIEIDAYSEMGGENRAHFNLFINDSLEADFLVEKYKKRYSVTWYGNLNDIDSIIIEFDNDSYGDFGDRNLLVKEICLDKKMTIPYLNHSVYDMGHHDGEHRIASKIISNAELARDRLIAMGLDTSKIKAVTAEKVRINRTLTSGLAFRDWLDSPYLDSAYKDIRGINIISLGPHSRRTWMTYNRILDEKYRIGIISIPDKQYKNITKREALWTLREAIGIIYYWFILIPY